MIRRLIRFIFFVAFVVLILAVAAALLKDTLVKEFVQRRIRKATGMDARIGQVEVNFLTPTVTIENLKLYNPPDFGGALCLSMPELHVEYDPGQVRAGRLHLTLMRLNVEEIDIVQDKKGRVNFDAAPAVKARGTNSSTHESVQFAGIDTLNLTLGAVHWSRLGSTNQRVYQFGIKNQVFHGIKSEADLAALVALASMQNTNFNFSDWMGSWLGR
ncbi:MAG TPA: hypothetical protein VHB20_07685 [Verrucomicrobiae bacterium]|jgi:hypothetical protein|nr:hypothetical protein [Verrucomicrobiae bacterium]